MLLPGAQKGVGVFVGNLRGEIDVDADGGSSFQHFCDDFGRVQYSGPGQTKMGEKQIAMGFLIFNF